MSVDVIFYLTIVEAGMFSCIIGFVIRILTLGQVICVLLWYINVSVKPFYALNRSSTCASVLHHIKQNSGGFEQFASSCVATLPCILHAAQYGVAIG